MDHFTGKYQGLKVAVGEWLNADAFELSLALLRVGIEVTDIFGTITEENFVYIRRIAQIHPETRIYSNLSPTMLNYACHEEHLDLTIGRDAGYYHPDCPNIPWNSENKPFGFAGVTELFRRMGAAMETEKGRRA